MSNVKPKSSNKILNLIIQTILIIIGATVFIYGLEAVVVANGMIDGGIVGIALMIEELTGIPLGVLIVIGNIPFIIFGFLKVGRTFAVQSAIGIVLAAALTPYFHGVPQMVDDKLTAVVIGGMLLGSGVGLVLRNNGVLDGTEILATFVSHKTGKSIGSIILMINLVIFAMSVFVYDLTSAFYSLLTYIVAFFVIDWVVEGGFGGEKAFLIMGENAEEIGDKLIRHMNVGITLFHTTGGYTKQEQKAMFCVVGRSEEANFKRLVNEIDPKCFAASVKLASVRGTAIKK